MSIVKGTNNDYLLVASDKYKQPELVVQLTGNNKGKILTCVKRGVEQGLDSFKFEKQMYDLFAWRGVKEELGYQLSKLKLENTSYWLPTKLSKLTTLGGGSFSKVYCAISQSGEMVALKVFSREENWRQELNNTQTLKELHPPKGICLPLDFGQTNKEWIIAYPQGINYGPDALYSPISMFRTSQIPVHLLVREITQLVEALSWIHLQGLFHGDVKLDNLLFTNQGLSFIDFELLGKTINPSKKLKYIRYRSPEMLADNIDFKTEVLALGVCLYQMFVTNLLHENNVPINEHTKKLVIPYQLDEQPPKKWSTPYLLSFNELDYLLAGILTSHYLPSEKPVLLNIFHVVKDMLTLDAINRPNAQEVCERLKGIYSE